MPTTTTVTSAAKKALPPFGPVEIETTPGGFLGWVRRQVKRWCEGRDNPPEGAAQDFHICYAWAEIEYRSRTVRHAASVDVMQATIAAAKTSDLDNPNRDDPTVRIFVDALDTWHLKRDLAPTPHSTTARSISNQELIAIMQQECDATSPTGAQLRGLEPKELPSVIAFELYPADDANYRELTAKCTAPIANPYFLALLKRIGVRRKWRADARGKVDEYLGANTKEVRPSAIARRVEKEAGPWDVIPDPVDREIVRLKCAGKTSKEIAMELSASLHECLEPHTINNRTSILRNGEYGHLLPPGRKRRTKR